MDTNNTKGDIRRIHPPAFKARVALEAIKEQKTIAELSSIYGIHSTQITKWKRKAIESLTQIFSDKWKQEERDKDGLIDQLYKQIGQLKVERDWIKKRLGLLKTQYHLGAREVILHIEKSAEGIPSIVRQAELLGISRSSVYYQPVPVAPETLFVMNRIDEIYTKRPFYGVRRITEQLRREGIPVNHKRRQYLMAEMGLAGLIPKRNLSKNNSPHPVYPYLLKRVIASYPNHIWGTDITYIRMAKGFLYLVAFLDWFSRMVLSWRLSTTLEIEFVLETAEEALTNYGKPDNKNSDQGIQYTSEQYTNIWKTYGVQISMDSRGRAMDNIFTERFWRSLKYEEVYLNSYETVLEAKERIGAYMKFYNTERFHQSHNYKTPSEIYFGNLKKRSIENLV